MLSGDYIFRKFYLCLDLFKDIYSKVITKNKPDIMNTIRKILSVLFVSSILILSVQGQDYVPGKNIKSITVTEEKADMLIKKQYKESETTFDAKGNILEEITYKEGKVNKHFKYQYDSVNNKIREEEYDPAGRLIEFSEYKIENGLRIEKIVYDGNKKMKSRKTYIYTTY